MFYDVIYQVNVVNPSEVLEELDNTAYANNIEDCEDNFNNSTNITNSTNTTNCALFNNCNGHGSCLGGKCLCYPGWTNYDCSISMI